MGGEVHAALADLAPFLLLAYVADAFWRVTPGALALVSHTGRAFRVVGSGVHLAGLLPTYRLFKSQRLLLLPTREGVFVLEILNPTGAAGYDPASFAFVPYAELALESDREEVVLKGTRRVRCASPADAAQWHGLIDTLRASAPSQRPQRLAAALAARLDLPALERQRAGVASHLRALDIASAALCGLGALILALVLLASELPPLALGGLLVALAVNFAATFLLAVGAARALRTRDVALPHAAVATLAMYPVAALHAAGALTPHLYAHFDWLAVAAALLPRDAFRRLARRELYGIEHALGRDHVGGWREHWELRRAALARLLVQTGLSEQEIRRPDAAHVDGARAWCPHCDAAYVRTPESCEECGGAVKSLFP